MKKTIPSISDFARAIDTELYFADIDRESFNDAVDELAAKLVSPKHSTLTYAGEHIGEGDDFVPLHVEQTEAELNWQGVCAMEFSPIFRAHFSHYYLHSIIRRLTEKPAADTRDDCPDDYPQPHQYQEGC